VEEGTPCIVVRREMSEGPHAGMMHPFTGVKRYFLSVSQRGGDQSSKMVCGSGSISPQGIQGWRFRWQWQQPQKHQKEVVPTNGLQRYNHMSQ
jgi:hypothetical protein